MSFQTLRTKLKQRLCISAGICSMGTGLPESIGACLAKPLNPVICLSGDGSMQFNIQELQTIFHHQFNIKIFIFNNDGYLAIRHTQKTFLERLFIGSNKKGGLSLPDFKKIASAYGIKTFQIKSHQSLKKEIQKILKQTGPVVCEVMVSPKQEVIPRMGFIKKSKGSFIPRPLEDLYPFLKRKDFLSAMLIKPCAESNN
jgi:acetolactate synthase-1/2/3 large subunit